MEMTRSETNRTFASIPLGRMSLSGYPAFRLDPDPAAPGAGGGGTTPPATPPAGGAPAGGGGTGGGRSTGVALNDFDPDGDEPLSREGAQQLIDARDKVKRKNALLLKSLGIDPKTVKVVATGDQKDPFRIESPQLAALQARIAADGGGDDDDPDAGDGGTTTPKRKTTAQQREAQLVTQHETALAAARSEGEQRVAVRDKLISNLAAVAPLRVACAEEGIFDADGDGSFRDVIKLIGDRVQTKLVELTDEDSGAITDVELQVIPLNADGTPMKDSTGKKNATLRDLVADWASTRPNWKLAGTYSGPGAGGARTNGHPTGNGRAHGQRATPNAPATAAERGTAAAASMFGKRAGTTVPAV